MNETMKRVEKDVYATDQYGVLRRMFVEGQELTLSEYKQRMAEANIVDEDYQTEIIKAPTKEVEVKPEVVEPKVELAKNATLATERVEDKTEAKKK